MIPSDSGGYSGHRADGYIDPFAIPGAGLDADMIRRAAASFTSASTAVTTHGADVVSKWSGISTSYKAPEASSLIETMAPVKTGTESLSAVFLAASQALTAFADEVDRIKPELLQLKGEAEQFITSVVGTTAEGTKIYDYIPQFADRNNDLMRRVAAQVDALAHARDTCVAALSGLDSPMYWLSRGAGQGPAASAPLDTSIGAVLPFGTMKERSCQEAQAHGAQDAFGESVKGGLAMVGFNAHTRQAFDGDLALHSWQGAAMSLFLVSTFVAHSDLTDPVESTPEVIKVLTPWFRAQRTQMVEGFLGSDEAWKTNPGRALGGLEFSVGSVLMPGAEAGAGLKVLASGARGLRFGARATELGAEGAADAARAGEASSGLKRALGGAGAVSGRVGDLVAGMSRGAASSVSGSVTGFRDLLARVPKVSVSVEHMVTPDGMRVPTLQIEMESRAHGHPGTGGGDRGIEDHSHEVLKPGDHGERPHGHTPHEPGAAHEATHSEASVETYKNQPRGEAHMKTEHQPSGGDLGTHGSEAPVVPRWITRVLENPDTPWKIRRLFEGLRFNYVDHGNFPHNEVRLEDGTRVDSYEPGFRITSRKHTQFADILEKTAKGYVDESDVKYAPGKLIAEVPAGRGKPRMFSDANQELGGESLVGAKVLRVPPQVHPIPETILAYAREREVIIMDWEGHVYT